MVFEGASLGFPRSLHCSVLARVHEHVPGFTLYLQYGAGYQEWME